MNQESLVIYAGECQDSQYNPVERCWATLENYWNGTVLDLIEAAVEWPTNVGAGVAGRGRLRGHPVRPLMIGVHPFGYRESMCRLLGYLGAPIALDQLLYKPAHSIVVQSYQPREMTAGLLNADGFGVGWYHATRETHPFTYKNILPVWNDVNLPSLSRYVESGCVLANVRSATPGLAVDLGNCQPFQRDSLLFVHNGFIEQFRHTLYRPMREQLSDRLYSTIHGTTDSEHIFALVLQALDAQPDRPLSEALYLALETLTQLGHTHQTDFSANIVLSNGRQLVASRYASRSPVPTLYWLRDDPLFPNAVVIASEPLFAGNWTAIADRSLLVVDHDLTITTHAL